jgi:hypothetical protein
MMVSKLSGRLMILNCSGAKQQFALPEIFWRHFTLTASVS